MMRSDSETTKRQKAQHKERLAEMGVILPDWLAEGAYERDLAEMVRWAERASERYRGGFGGSLCKDARG